MGDSDLYQDLHKPAAFHKCSSVLLVLLTSSGDSSLTYDTEWFKSTCLSISGHLGQASLVFVTRGGNVAPGGNVGVKMEKNYGNQA